MRKREIVLLSGVCLGLTCPGFGMKYQDEMGAPAEEVHEWCNLTQVGGAGGEKTRQAIRRAAELGMKVLLRYSAYSAGTSEDYRRRLDVMAASIRGLEKHILAVYLLDEPRYHLWTPGQVKELVDIYASHPGFQGIPSYISYGGAPPKEYIPDSLTWPGMFSYFNPVEREASEATQAQFERVVLRHIAELKEASGGRPYLLIAQSYTDERRGGLWAMPGPEQQKWYIDAVRNDPLIVGVSWFTWQQTKKYAELVEAHRRFAKDLLGIGVHHVSSEVGQGEATIRWETNEPADSGEVVLRAEGVGRVRAVDETPGLVTHIARVKGLLPDVRYLANVVSLREGIEPGPAEIVIGPPLQGEKKPAPALGKGELLNPSFEDFGPELSCWRHWEGDFGNWPGCSWASELEGAGKRCYACIGNTVWVGGTLGQTVLVPEDFDPAQPVAAAVHFKSSVHDGVSDQSEVRCRLRLIFLDDRDKVLANEESEEFLGIGKWRRLAFHVPACPTETTKVRFELATRSTDYHGWHEFAYDLANVAFGRIIESEPPPPPLPAFPKGDNLVRNAGFESVSPTADGSGRFEYKEWEKYGIEPKGSHLPSWNGSHLKQGECPPVGKHSPGIKRDSIPPDSDPTIFALIQQEIRLPEGVKPGRLFDSRIFIASCGNGAKAASFEFSVSFRSADGKSQRYHQNTHFFGEKGAFRELRLRGTLAGEADIVSCSISVVASLGWKDYIADAIAIDNVELVIVQD